MPHFTPGFGTTFHPCLGVFLVVEELWIPLTGVEFDEDMRLDGAHLARLGATWSAVKLCHSATATGEFDAS